MDHRGPRLSGDWQARSRRYPDDLPDRTIRSSSIRLRAPAPGRRRSSTRCRPATSCLMYETGHFAALWQKLAERLGLAPSSSRRLAARRRSGGDRRTAEGRQGPRDQGRLRRPQRDLHRLRRPRSTRSARAIDAAGHPALLLVDTISSLGSIDYRHDEWGVDVTVGGSQKGLMLPPGLSFNAVSDKAIAAQQVREAAALLLGVGRDAGAERQRLLSLHAGDQPSLRPRCGDRHAARGRARQRLCPS